jgi:hypothetical protein
MKQPYLIALILFAPFLSIAGQDGTLHPWTDTQGRTLQASFISFDAAAQTVTIKMSNGVVYPAPLSSLSAESQALAKQLAAPKPASPPPSTSSPFDEVVDEVIAAMPADALGPEALDIDHDWSSADGRPLSAKFISLVGDQLTLAMNGGAKEFTLPISKFSEESKALATVLQAVAKKHRPAPPKPAKPVAPAKPVKVVPPKVVEADLDKVHTWTSADGRPLEATFVSADDKGIDLKMRGRSSAMNLPWSKLDAQSVALGKALQALKKSLIPTILGGNENNLERYGSGKWRNYNTYIESVAFEAGVLSNGKMAHFWLLKDGQRVQSSPFSVHFEGTFKDERGSWGGRQIVSLETSPPATNDRRTTTVKGKWNNGGTFEYNFELSSTGLSFWGDAKEPSSSEFATSLRIWMRAPSVVADAKNASMEDIQKASGDGALYVDPMNGKRIKFSFDEKWLDIKKKLTNGGKKDIDYNPVKYAEFNGFPFGDHKIKAKPASTRTGHLVWYSGYSQIFPAQGAMLIHRSADGAQAMHDFKNAASYKDRLKIKKGERLTIQIIRGG